jgi:hypothetical protein
MPPLSSSAAALQSLPSSTHGVPMGIAGPSLAVSCASVSTAATTCGLQRRLEHQILWRVSADEQLREQDQVGASRSRLDAGAALLVGIASDIASNWIELG